MACLDLVSRPLRTTVETKSSITDTANRRLRQLEIGFGLLAIVLGFVHVWADHHYLTNSDAMSYLDVADAYLRKDWQSAINAYWSPLYAWLIALALFLVKPSPYWKFSVLHLVNFVIYLFALGCFGYLIRELVRLNRSLKDELLANGLVTLPGWALVAIGYPLFIWSSLYLIVVHEESPDLLVAAFIYLACGIVLRIRRQSSKVSFLMLGIVLGLGYLAKSIMLPMALILLAASTFSIGKWRRALALVAVALIAFILIAGPFVFAISRAKGRLTFGESGKLNYLWAINRIPLPHWQGDEPGHGKPLRTTRKLLDVPPVYEFDDDVGGTYPLWYDPTYWYEGSVTKFDFKQQVRVFGTAFRDYYDLLHKWGLQYGLLVGLLSLYLVGRRGRLLLEDFSSHWSLIIPALAGIAVYSLVNVQGRYVASFFVLLWLDLFSAVRLPSTPDSQRLIRSIAIALMAVMTFTAMASSAREASLTVRHLVAGEDRNAHEQWQVAEGLREMGLVAGDKVAVIGMPPRSFWAHLAKLRIMAELDSENAGPFWEGNSTLKDEVIKTFARTEAKAIVMERPPAGVDLSGWKKIRNTNCYVYLLKT